MKFHRLVALLPCQSLDDLSLDRTPHEADQLLTAWSILWHPRLLADAAALPAWESGESPPEGTNEHLILIPSCSGACLPEGWRDHARADAACVIELDQQNESSSVLNEVLAHLDPAPADIDPELVADFLALGTAYLWVELLTRQMRYMNSLDVSTVEQHVISAAQAAAAGDQAAAQTELQAAYDALHQSREYFYPAEARLIDLTLVAPGTAGEALRQELSAGSPCNLLLSAEALEELANHDPAALHALQEALQAEQLSIAGGEYGESPLPLLSTEAIAWELRRGRERFAQHLGRAPAIFGRRRYGLMSLLPQLLRKAGFTAALHFTLDDGRFPTANQSRVVWEGIDGTAIDALMRVPLDARRHDTFLRLPERLSDVLDLDHASTLVFAHWPSETSPWYRTLQRIARHSPVLGTFATLDECFSNTERGQTIRHPTDDYRAPYLRQDVAAGRPDPISRYVRYHGRHASLEVQQWLAALSAIVSGTAGDELSQQQWQTAVAAVENELAVEADLPPQLDQSLAQSFQRQLRAFAETLHQSSPRPRAPSEAWSGEGPGVRASSAPPAQTGRLWLNPFPTAAVAAICDEALSAEQPPSATVREVPSLGYAWLGSPDASSSSAASHGKGKPEPPMAEGNVVRNEFFDVTISTASGTIQSLIDYSVRGNRLSQQIVARRQPSDESPDDWYQYSSDPDASELVMALEEMKITSSGPIVGEIVSRGRLVDRDGRRAAGYVQTTRTRRGSRVLELQIELDPDWLPQGDPWNSYYAARFAWSGTAANLYRSAGLVHRRTELGQFEAPHFAEVRSGKARTTFLTAGLPYHRRHQQRMLDTLLIVPGETARTFRLGVGIDLPAPAAAALQFLAPPTVLSDVPCPSPDTARWFELDAPHVVPTLWEPLVEEGHVAGFRVRLLETEGKEAAVLLKCFRPVEAARKADVSDEAAAALAIDEDRVKIPLRPCEWALIECRWKLLP